MKRTNRRIVLPVERTDTSRRTFLKMAGFGVAAGTLAACSRAPVRHVVPRVDADEDVVPGRPYWIATTCGGCAAGCGAVARCVDGRPVKLEGNEGHPVSAGGLCAVGQAQVLTLYDSRRLAAPSVGGTPTTWDAFDARVRERLEAAKGKVRLLTGTLSGPSTAAWIATFCRTYDARHVTYDALPASAIARAHEEAHGVRVVPTYRFERARVVASFGADFLGTWISPVAFAAGWRAHRRPDETPPQLSRHWQAEARMSLTGSRADRRVALAPHETAAVLAELCDALAGDARPARLAAAEPRPWVREMAADLVAAGGESLVVCGEDDLALQRLVVVANERLGNHGRTVDVAAPCRARLGDTEALRGLLAEMAAGGVEALVVAGCNPAYDLPGDVRAAVTRCGFVVAIAPLADETTALAHAVAPRLHALESWDDAEPRPGVVSLAQPAIRPLRAGRTIRECLARWCGDARHDAELLRAAHAAAAPASAAWDEALRRGWIETRGNPRVPAFRGPAVAAAADAAPPAGAFALVVYPKVGLLDGSHAENAWLQELPDPVTKCAWDNYACVAPATAAALGVRDGDVVRVSAEGAPAVELPVLVQPGQHDGVVAVALGYGRSGTDRFSRIGPEWIEARPTVESGGTVGRNAAPWLVLDDRGLRTSARNVRVERTGVRRDLACTQDHHRLEVPAHLAPRNGAVRDAVRTIAPAALAAGAHGGDRGHATTHGADLWPPDHAHTRRWGLVVDLSACDGCSACVVACQAENNVPCVGRDEVLRHREMQWLRIDRYWTGEGGATTASHQPMMCQHCENAPCETVCPVLATAHSAEGLNQQAYNRCVGTRYCANNCPYKVRRFNWFDYPRSDAVENLALNPRVTVRTRGVMEKCSFCVQRIQDAKAAAKARGVPLADGDVRPACAQSCPAGALTFGDLTDPAGAASRRLASGRAYQVLSELRVKPGVTYLADVRDRPEGANHGG